MKIFVALCLCTCSAASTLAQIAPAPGLASAGQAQQAFMQVQAQAMSITSRAQLQGMILAQAGMLTNVQARGMFLTEAAGLQARVNMNQNAMFSAQMAAMGSAQHAMMLQRQMQAQSAIARMLTLGIDNANAVQGAVRMASLDPAKMSRLSAMLHAEAAQASGQAASTTAQKAGADASSAADAAAPSLEPPPMMIRPTFGNALVVEKPKFSVDPGKVNAGTKVRIKSETHYVTLYYTTNGWTPTTQSAKYTGPITINRNTHLEVIAVGPNFVRSGIEQADYAVGDAPPQVAESAIAVPADGTLRAGTPVRVVFTGKDIDSDSANVGDDLSLVLDEDIMLDGKLLTARGTPIKAALTVADPGHGPAPGDLVFEVQSFQVGGRRVPLFGGETLEGAKGGKNAVIKPGMTATAFVSADVALK